MTPETCSAPVIQICQAQASVVNTLSIVATLAIVVGAAWLVVWFYTRVLRPWWES